MSELAMYGDYELKGEIDAKPGATVYRARRRNRDYILKICCSPGVSEEPPRTETGPAPLAEDPKLQLLNSVKLQKEAIKAGSRRFAPIYEAGYAPDGRAWYATAYYPRGSLKRWVASGLGVDDQSLRWVFKNLLRGLLDLKRATGRSHGNLKLANILMGGRAGTPLEDTPLFLVDPLADLKAWAGSTELSDLRSLGQILYQLVMKREAGTEVAIPYPVPDTQEWSQLGERKSYWLELCNRLLDPELSLQAINLQRLAVELGINKRAANPAWIGIALLLILVAGAGFWFLNYKKQRPEPSQPSPDPAIQAIDVMQVRARQDPQNAEQEFNQSVDLAEQAEKKGNFKEALKHYSEALQWKTNDVKCRDKVTELRSKIRAHQQTAEMFNVALIIARAAEQAGSFTNALERYIWALNFDDNNAEVKEKIRELEPKAQAQRLATTNLAQALSEAQTAEKSGDFIVASALYQAVEQLSPENAMAKAKIEELSPKAEKQRQGVGRLMKAWQETTNLIARADQLISEKKYSEAASELDRAIAESRVTLEIDPSPDLKELHQALIKKAQGVREFDQEMKLGQKAFEQKSFTEARQHFTRALELIPDDDTAIQRIDEINRLQEEDRFHREKGPR